MSKFWPIALIGTAGLVIAGIGALSIAVHQMPKPVPLEAPDYASAVYDREGRLLRLSLSEKGLYRLPIRYADISPDLIKATLAYEDRYFWKHPGVNPFSIVRAGFQSLLSRPIGASTITMQVARMEQKLNTRTIRGKLEQVVWALRYEVYYSKEEILEKYFTLAPYGGNIEGAEAASQLYFGKPAKALLPSEATALAVIPQNPVKRNPAVSDGAFDRAREQLAHTLIEEEVYPARLSAALTPAMPPSQFDRVPFEAPHFVRQVTQENPGQKHLVTTLDIVLNRRLQSVLTEHIEALQSYGIKNGAFFVIDTRNNEVIADVGSADFFNDSIEGEVDGTLAKRSVGSTLKPFIYALALDQGKIHSESIVIDEPKNWHGYRPQNEDGQFAGPLSAREALVRSRNIPALVLESELHPDLYDLLQTADARLPQPREYYGLPIALGTAGLSMQKLTELYAALANGGRWQPATQLKQHEPRHSKALVSEEAAWIVRQMLASQGLTVSVSESRTRLQMKTGTSNGYRDAWAAGLAGPYAITVWLGNFNNRPNAKLKGADVAAPLFVDLAKALLNTPGFRPSDRELQLDNPPAGVTKVAVCPATGDLQKDAQGVDRCTNTVPAWFIPGKSPIAPSPWLKAIRIDPKTGLQSCDPALGTLTYVESWPTHLEDLLRANGKAPQTAPAYDPACREATLTAQPPQILSPSAGSTYFVGTASETEATVLLQASSRQRQSLYWYDGAVYLGRSASGQPLAVALAAGEHRLSVTDEAGNRAQTRFIVKQP